MVADDPSEKIALKAFYCQILNDNAALKAEEDAYKSILIIRQVNSGMVNRNYLQIKQDVQNIASSEIDRMMNDPELSHLVIKKN